MNKIHLVLQGKGGVGKSFVASLLGQFYAKNKRPVVCIDTDPVNATFAGYQSIGAERLKLMVGPVLDERNFDQLIERIIHAKSDFVIDNGASSFLPLSHYIAENSIVKLLDDNGYQVVFHSVLTGGQALGDTLAGLAGTLSLASAATPVVVWINEYFGDVRHEGTPFEEMDVYVENRDKIAALVRIPRQTSSTFGKDVQIMLEQKLTFDDVRLSEGFGIMAKQRLGMVEKALFGQMEEFGVA